MNICLFAATLDKKGGGPSRSVPILAKGLSSIGINTFLLTFQSDDMNLHILEGSGVNTIILPINAKEIDILKVFLDNKIDVIHSQGIWLPIYDKVCKMARENGIPYIMTPRGSLEPWCLKSENIWKRYKKKIAMLVYQKNDLQKSSMILATSKMEAENIRKLGLSNPIAIIPNGIIIDDYPCRGFDYLKKVKKQVVFLSRIVPKKGIEILLESWKQLIPLFPNWNLVIVGNGEKEYIDKLNVIIKEYNIRNSVEILPPAFGVEKYNLYVESSLFVLPTHSENFGMVIAEALSCGLPVITTKGTPWQELVSSKAGWWIELSPNNLTEALKEAFEKTNEELFDMGQRGAKLVRDMYDYVHVSRRMAEAYRWMMKGGDKPNFILI